MTITNAAIRAGAKIYSLIGDTVTLLGTATVDGSATATFSDDPEIVIANPPGSSGSSGSSGGSSSSSSTTTPTPTVDTTKPATETPSPAVTTPAVTPTPPKTTLSNGQALVETRDPSGNVTSAIKSVFVSPSDPAALVVSLATAQVVLSSTNINGVANPVQNTTLTFTKGSEIKIAAEGFLPNSEVSVYIFSTPRLLGKVMTDSKGSYTSTLASPSDLEVGSHTIQLIGFLKDESLATLSLPALVVQSSVKKTLKVYFEMGSTTLGAAQSKLLKGAIAKVDKKKIYQVSIKGFAQRTASQVNDEKLPLLRAKSVAALLKALGISTKPSITEGGYAPERSELARRVEITLKIAG
jgi:outer membrane protein OmpA-like peptidoglycan-associated protein